MEELQGPSAELLVSARAELQAINETFAFMAKTDMPPPVAAEHGSHRVRRVRVNRYFCEDCGAYVQVVTRASLERRKLLRY